MASSLSNHNLSAIPYFQFINAALKLNFSQLNYTPVANKKINSHYPFTVMDLSLINEPLEDIAIACADDESIPENTNATKTNQVFTNQLQQQIFYPLINDCALTKKEASALNVYRQKLSSTLFLHPSFNCVDDRYLNTDTQPKNESINSTNNTDINELTSHSEETKKPSTTKASTNDTLKNTDAKNKTTCTLNNQEQNNENTEKLATTHSHDISASNQKNVSDHTTETLRPDNKVKKEKAINEELTENNDKNKNKKEAKPLTEEEIQRKEKEAKLESYKQFIAEQKNEVEVDYQGIRIDIEANALPSRMYFIMNALSAIIASYGLVVNSAAVVIGAMLVAMMLGPISGTALAIIDYRIPFLRKSLLTVLAGGTMVMAIGLIVGFVHRDIPLTNEILSRTQPTSMDLMIALAGGTAGAYAMISPHLSVAVVGVAVATALVPPLAASGILFAHGHTALGFGALLLAFTNIVAIQFTNALVLWFSGFRRLVDDDYKTNPLFAFCRRNAVPLILLSVIAAYLTYNFNIITKRQSFETHVQTIISDYFGEKDNSLTSIQFIKGADHQTVRALIRGQTRPSSYDAKHLETTIGRMKDEDYPRYLPVHVQIRYMPVIVINSNPDEVAEFDDTDAEILSQ